MKIEIGYPPNIEKIRAVFGDIPSNVIFTYGDTIFNPSGNLITEDLIKHESIHTEQQGDNPDAWWDRYFVDKEFRLSQEVEAYQAQFVVMKKFVKDRNVLNKHLIRIASDLSGKIYGNIISFNEAMKVIQKKS